MSEGRINLTDRQDFSHRVHINPLDYALGVHTDFDLYSMDQRILEIFTRFWNLGFIHEHGNKCFFMSYLLRRILRLHGIEAHVKQVTFYYHHDENGWRQVVGEPMNITHSGSVDSHCVVVAGEYLLDFSLLVPLHYAFGVRAPVAIIGKFTGDNNDTEQDFGELGKGIYTLRRPHSHTKHIIYEEREGILDQTRKYFNWYRM